MASAEQEHHQTPFDLVGGAQVVRQIVDRFYDLMDQESAYARLRALHAPDLDPMRSSLTGFLIAWLGGPRDWFVEHPGVCMMSTHARLPVTEGTALEWSDAMRRAIADSTVDPALGAKMAEALSSMAQGMIRPAARAD
ncbi:group II truncated hemoglobin [Sphingobium sp. D43FB]|uniref:group II truncated hemoglobin n=1 Tax=Sphingobium sp. D43FB TaxID=2017595 RepID=UPI0020D11D0F|nr:group II truncated hemoglobin [Sphingobium sp. D43FB]